MVARSIPSVRNQAGTSSISTNSGKPEAKPVNTQVSILGLKILSQTSMGLLSGRVTIFRPCAQLIAEIVVLKWNVQTGFLEHGNDALQVVSFLAAYSEFLTLNSRLNLDLSFLDHFHELSRQI